MYTSEVAKLCKVSTGRVRQWVDDGRLKPIARYTRLLVFAKKDVVAFQRKRLADQRKLAGKKRSK